MGAYTLELRGGKTSSHPSKKERRPRSFFFWMTGHTDEHGLTQTNTDLAAPGEGPEVARSVSSVIVRVSPVSVLPYPPSTAFLKSSPGPGSLPIQVLRMASAVGLPGSVPLTLPATSTVVPVPGT